MSDPPTRPRRRLSRVLIVIALAIAVMAVAFYSARRVLAREALIGWLKARGIASDATIDSIGLGGLTGRIRIGDIAAPDFTAANVEATYGLRGLSLELRSVTLKKPVLRAAWRGGQLRMGSLDPLIAELRKRPPRPDAKQPRIRIDDGVVLLATDYGPVRIDADVLLEDGKLISLNGTTAAAQLKGSGFAASLGRGTVALAKRGSRADLRLEMPVTAASASESVLSGGHLMLTANAPYPDLVKQRGDGALTLAARMTAARLTAAGQTLEGADLSAGFAGQVTGWITTFAVRGKGAAVLNLASGDLGGGRARGLKASLAADDLSWSRPSGRLAATVRATATGEQVAMSELTLRELVVAARGPISADAKGVRLALGGSALGRGAWTGLGAPGKDDAPQLVALKRAARGFRFAAPAVQVAYGAEPSARLVQPIVVRPDSGGELRLAMRGADVAAITVSGGGLPTLDANLSRVRFYEAGAAADVTLKAGLSLGPLVGGQFDTAGRLTVADRTVTYAAARCTTFRAERLDFGERGATGVSGQLCPAGGPLFRMQAPAWRLAARLREVAAEIPSVQVRLADGGGAVDFHASGGRLAGDARIEAARISDTTTPEARFSPLVMSGPITLANDVVTGDFAFAQPSGARIATAKLRHETATGAGGVDIDTGPLMFAEGGLQPEQLSPLLKAIGGPASGEARVTGGVAWTPGAGFSAGKLTVPRLDFTSPAGRVTGLSGEIALASLGPLIAAPGQQLRAERLEALVPITNVKAQIEIRDEVLRITGGEASIEGGRVLIESLNVPLSPDAPMTGVLAIDGVQLKNLVEASPFKDWMDLDARVSGKLPFEAADGKVRIASGNLEAIAPGRLTIRRELFTGGAAKVDASVEGQAVATTPAVADPNQTFTDMAYQAMEDLAFDEMGATVNSLPNGRLGVLFHIKGRHDPPEKQQIRLSVIDLVRQRFMGKPLPLPSDTQVNLTLDTTLNLDDLLADYVEFNRTRGSAKVQP